MSAVHLFFPYVDLKHLSYKRLSVFTSLFYAALNQAGND